ncbi:hypothetical protein BLOT_016252 [Blomia tropicalis]|nr:hypothetical protein BLOT_016252 [Blomia tropicalis]
MRMASRRGKQLNGTNIRISNHRQQHNQHRNHARRKKSSESEYKVRLIIYEHTFGKCDKYLVKWDHYDSGPYWHSKDNFRDLTDHKCKQQQIWSEIDKFWENKTVKEVRKLVRREYKLKIDNGTKDSNYANSMYNAFLTKFHRMVDCGRLSDLSSWERGFMYCYYMCLYISNTQSNDYDVDKTPFQKSRKIGRTNPTYEDYCLLADIFAERDDPLEYPVYDE